MALGLIPSIGYRIFTQHLLCLALSWVLWEPRCVDTALSCGTCALPAPLSLSAEQEGDPRGIWWEYRFSDAHFLGLVVFCSCPWGHCPRKFGCLVPYFGFTNSTNGKLAHSPRVKLEVSRRDRRG